MSIAKRIRSALERTLTAEMWRVNSRLEAEAPIPDATVPPLDELQRVLADLQKRQPWRHAAYFRAEV
ncbi:hypothetical protein OG785_45605 [Streptomyces sp. NBC_00006]|uniref:hypothetical protein n=1 Tax=Streptomyces sp. NBC_00006 TaxID=2975619 RepID=UPI00224EBF41|nr:hypothetical protein [Streptomyces sp. NBC_00006]MCX5537837.1 hypothetical protein [Streptomyces sp. NBC_00006]